MTFRQAIAIRRGAKMLWSRNLAAKSLAPAHETRADGLSGQPSLRPSPNHSRGCSCNLPINLPITDWMDVGMIF